MGSSWIRATAVTLAVGLAVTVCSSGGSDSASGPVDGTWDDIVAAAIDEGSVHLYSTQHPENLAALEVAFETRYPDIDLEFTRGSDVELNPRVETEARTGKGIADVHMLSDPAWTAAAAESGQYSTEVVGPAFDSAEYDREAAVLSDRFFLTSAAVFALGWNTDSVPGGLSSPSDLLDPQLKGRIGIVNPAGFAAVVDEYKFFDENWAGGNFNDKLAELEPRVYPGALAVVQALVSGEIVASPMVPPLVREESAGAPVGWVLPEPAWGTPWYSHVLRSAPHPNAAQVLADFMVTDAGQAALSTGYGSALEGTPNSVASARDIELPDTTNLTSDGLARYQQQWEQLFLD
ncbi:ABC transporter substrate-binding protein [Rhodococcoides yunnanense]|uniref:ABC transporter substrate-binding protein n=1 Tax=Rhodococcoides yunnanense TaxID=278209 RepID=UPI0009334971|nr:extracellular solute-binding protein [Rhodococcus yunnanensis]